MVRVGHRPLYLPGGLSGEGLQAARTALAPLTPDAITRYLTLTGRPKTVTPATTTPESDPHRFAVEFWNVDEHFNHRNGRMTSDLQVSEEAYLAKRAELAKRIRDSDPAVLGLAGVESLWVLEELLEEEALADRGYTIVHFESPDVRGLDTAVLTKFPVLEAPALHVVQRNDSARGVLEATLDLDGIPLHLFVMNAQAEVSRDVARMVRHLVAERRAEDPDAEIMLMGDLGTAFAGEDFRDMGVTTDAERVAAKSEGAVFFHASADHPTTVEDGKWSIRDGIMVTSGLLDRQGLRLVDGSVKTLRPGPTDAKVSRHLRLRAEIERVGDAASPNASPTNADGRLVAPGVWLRDSVATVRQRIGDPVPPHNPELYRDLTGPALVNRLVETRNHPLVHSYYDARQELFKAIANEDGWVECVYTGKRIETDGIPDASIMNTEHTGPASQGIENTAQLADLHHLYPSDPKANTRRSSLPFGVVKNVEWEEGGSKMGTDAEGRLVFEPRDEHKGAAARSLAYLALHGFDVEPWQRPLLTAWSDKAPPTESEQRRNDLIARLQGNRNPFIDEPALVERLWR